VPDLQAIRQLLEDIGPDATLRLMGVFKDDADKRIQAIRDILAAGGDGAEMRIHAHSLKGLCRTYGAADAGDVAMALQEACEGDDRDVVLEKAKAALDLIPGEVDAAIAAAKDLAGG